MQGDGQRKFRPAIVLGIVPPYNDLLVCAVSSQVQREVKVIDLVVDESHPDYKRMGLRITSVVRVVQLTTLPDKVIQGAIGSVSTETLGVLKSRLRDWLK